MKKLALHFSYNLALLLTLPVAFISAYVWLYFYPSSSIYQHLNIITLIVFSILSLKFLINHYIKNKKLVLYVNSVLYSSFFFGLAIYYLLVLIGLHSWNRVITEEFIIAYANQAHFFFDAIGISYNLVIILAISFYTLLTVASYFFLKKFHWLPEKKNHSTWLIGPLILSICMFCIYTSYDYLISSDTNSKEPIKLTLFSGKIRESHEARLGYSTDHQLNSLEDIARKNYQATPSEKKRNLIVFVVDALRPDHTSMHSYYRNTTPHLQEMITLHGGKVFTQARSVCGETTCAHAGYMASRFVYQLPDNIFTLQEVLKLNGYTTNLIISGDHINFHNIREVYGEVDHYYDGSMAEGYYFNDDAVTINKTKSLPNWDGRPTMIHYHILSAHQVGKKEAEFSIFTPSESYLGKRSGSPDMKYTNFYDNGVLQADAVINTLLETLASKKYLENSLVIITADHGEALGEHDFFMHTNSVIEEALKIPLIMIPYGYKSNIMEQQNRFISLIDLAPSILKEFNINTPESWAGTPIQANLERPFSYFEMTPYKGFYDHRQPGTLWKYWQNSITGEEYAFNISMDPKERTNLFWKVPAKLKQEWRETNLKQIKH
ncbi:MAG: sulfatase-like hydrolase/transferase [Methylotenera sp.]|nr:sulfatase-like hydrolase/transferase [Methylotenera sp.]